MKNLSLLVCLSLLSFACSVEWTVFVGAPFEDANEGWVLHDFVPRDLSISSGDTVTWVFVGLLPHTVTFSGGERIPFFVNTTDGLFFNPLTRMVGVPPNGMISSPPSISNIVSSGVLPPNSTFSLTFDLPEGTVLPYEDILHPFINGVIRIGGHVSTPQQVGSEAQALFERLDARLGDLEEAEAEEATFPPFRFADDGTRIWSVRIISGGILHLEYLRFIPSNITVELGDSIEFYNGALSVHIVAFNGTNLADIPDWIIPTPTGVMVNPLYEHPSGGQNFTGGFATAGLLRPAAAVGTDVGLSEDQPFEWTITFNALGTFPFECPIHDELGMVGVVHVVPRGSLNFG